jgi:hypothetical protein
MGYTVQDMQRDILLAANKAQVDHSQDEIVDALDEVIHAIEGEEEIPPPEFDFEQAKERHGARQSDRQNRTQERRNSRA